MSFIYGIIWFVLAFVLGSTAKSKGRSFGGFLFLGLILSPLIGFIILLVMGDNKEKIIEKNLSTGVSKRCPSCANEIKKEATVCHFCGKELPKINELLSNSIGDLLRVNQKMKLYQEQNNYDLFFGELNVGDIVQYINRGNNVSVAGISEPAPMFNVKTKNGNIGFAFLVS